MLDYWYSDRCHRQIKLLVCIVVCLIIYFSAQVATLSPMFTLLSLGLGILIHALKQWEYKLKAQQRHIAWLDAVMFITPLCLWLAFVIYLPALNKWALMLQVIGFSTMGLLVVSIYTHRAKRADH